MSSKIGVGGADASSDSAQPAPQQEPPLAPGKLIRYLWQLTLPEFWAVAIFPVYIGYVIGSRSMIPTVESILALIIMGPLIMGSTLMLNECFDIEIDRRNPRKAKSPLIQGLIEPENALNAAVALMAIGILLATVISFYFAAVVGAAILLSLLYSVRPVRFKELPGADLWVNATGLGILCPLAGYLSAFNPVAPFPLGFLPVAFFGLGAAYIPTTMMDYEVDRACGINSISVKLGIHGAFLLGFGFIATSIGTIILLGLLDLAPFGLAILAKIGPIGVVTVFLYWWLIRKMNYHTYWTHLAILSIVIGVNIFLWLLWYTGVWVI